MNIMKVMTVFDLLRLCMLLGVVQVIVSEQAAHLIMKRCRKTPNKNEGFPPVVKLIYRGTLILSFLANGIVQPL